MKDELHSSYVHRVDGLWAHPQQNMFSDLGWETFSGSWPTSGILEPTRLWTLSSLALHSADAAYSVCSLAEILEPHVAPKYYLSPRACRGILRRATKRGRTLPPALQQALDTMATQAPEEMEATT